MSELKIIAINKDSFENIMNVKVNISKEYEQVLLDRLDEVVKFHPDNLHYNYSRKVFAFTMLKFKVRFDINLKEMVAEISGPNLSKLPELKDKFIS